MKSGIALAKPLLLIVIAVLVSTSPASASRQTPMIVNHMTLHPPHPPHPSFELVAHLRMQDPAALDSTFWDVSTPGSPRYLQHPSVAELSKMVGASDADVAAASTFLTAQGALHLHVSPLRHTITASFASQPSIPIKSSLPGAIEMVHRRPAPSSAGAAAEVPKAGSENAHARDMEKVALGSYTIKEQKAAYGIPVDLQATNHSTTQMVWGPGTFGYSKLQLLTQKLTQVPLLDLSKVKFDTANHGRAGGDNYMEGNLDTKMISSFGLNANTIVSNTNTSAATEEGEGFGPALLDFVTALADRPHLPQVLSMSLGSLSAYSCNLLCEKAVAEHGITEKECSDYIAQQRQVCMIPSVALAQRVDAALQVLGARGVSVFGSSGDGGSHFSFQPFGGLAGGKVAAALNAVSCQYQMPVFPTSSAYIVSVGATEWAGGGGREPVAWPGSGGGFSWQFPRPQHQTAAVEGYLNATKGLPDAASYNATGRAFPDVAAVGVEGTSMSCPIVAGIFSLIMDRRLNAGLPPLGFLGPRIWQVAAAHPGEAFEDVTVGNTADTSSGPFCKNGFPATTGWDPVTGWGRPVWKGMLEHFGKDPA